MDVVLMHGQGRSPASLFVLAWRLRQRGHRVHLFRYRVRRESFAAIVARFVAWLPSRVGTRPYLLVGHSLGSIVARASLPLLTAHPPCHLVMLAPPNQSSLLARRLQHHPLYRALTGDCGQRLADPAFAASLPQPTVPTTIIAGTLGPRGPRSPFGDAPNDGVVSVAETRLSPDDDLLLIPAIHTFIMNAQAVTQRIAAILDDQDQHALDQSAAQAAKGGDGDV